MKKVEMMKKAIAASKNPAWKWTADANGLHWSYGVDFTLTIEPEPAEEGSYKVKFEDERAGVRVVVFTTKDDFLYDGYHDFVATVDEAIYWAAVKIIHKAEYLY